MDYVLINALLYIVTLFLYWRKNKEIDAGFVLLGLYTLVAIIGVLLLYYAEDKNYWKLTLWPYIYLYVVFMLFFRPFLRKKNHLLAISLYVKNVKFVNVIAFIYITVAIIIILFNFNKTISVFLGGDWLAVRTSLYQGETILYESLAERIALNLFSYLRPLAIIIFFYYLTKQNIRKRLKVLLALAILIPSFILAILLAARGSLFNIILEIIVVYLIFRKDIPKATNRLIKLFFILFLSFAISLVIGISTSRFGVKENFTMLLYYFGHSFMKFNDGLVDTIHTYANGNYFFSWFSEFFNTSNQLLSTSIDQALGTHFGSSFTTFVGSLYIDFGPILTLGLAVFVPIIISLAFKKRNYIGISGIYMYVFYLTYLLRGVFVIGSGNSLYWFGAIIIFTTLRILKV